MANIQKMFCEEIRRLAKKEAKAAMEPLKTQIAGLKKQLQRQKELVQNLQKESSPSVAPEETSGAITETPENSSVKFRMNAERIRKIRKGCGLTQMGFARILGVSHSAVVKWELGKISPRKDAKARIVAIGKMGKRELQQIMDKLKSSKETTSQE